MADELAKLIAERRALTERIGQIEHEVDSAETAPLVGRFWKYRNCYSCPESDDDYWWLYVKTTGHDGRWLSGFMFERANGGRSTAEPFTHRMLHGYEEISAGEFNAAWDTFLRALIEDQAKRP